MNILKRFKKKIVEENKIKRLAELFDEMKTLFPGHEYAVSLSIHGIDLALLDEKVWKIDSKTAERIKTLDGVFDITIFGKEK